jgi:hypothetical protein
MTDPLDQHIRELVAGLMAATPEPPQLGRIAVASDRVGGERRRGWPIALGAAVVVLVVGGGWLLFLRGGSPSPGTSVPLAVTTAAETTSTTEVTSTTATVLDMVQLQPIRLDCTSQLDSFPCSALIDDDPDNFWNARNGGVNAVLTFIFSPPVQILEVTFQNLADDERFRRNARIKGIEITLDDLPQAIITELEDTNAPQRVQLRSLRTSRLTITITSAYPGQMYEGHEPFAELALAEVQFWGRLAPEIDDTSCTLLEGTLTVPYVIGLSEADASLMLEEAGICPDQMRFVHAEPFTEGSVGYVIATDPAAGANLPVDGVITLTDSYYPAACVATPTTSAGTAGAFVPVLDELGAQVSTLLHRVCRIEHDWETRQASLYDTTNALDTLKANAETWAAAVAGRTDVPPELEAAYAVLIEEANHLPAAVEAILLGVQAPDDGTQRRTAVAAFEAGIQDVLNTIDTLRRGA